MMGKTFVQHLLWLTYPLKSIKSTGLPIFLRSRGRSDLSCKEHVSEEVAQSNTGVGSSSEPDLFVTKTKHGSHILFLP